jgi:hypothetical protein
LTRDSDPDPRALPLFVELAGTKNSSPDTENQAKAIGLVGQAVIYHRRGQSEKSAECISELAALVGSLDPNQVFTVLSDPQMEQLARWVIEKNTKVAGRLKAEELDKWLKSQPAEDPAVGQS